MRWRTARSRWQPCPAALPMCGPDRSACRFPRRSTAPSWPMQPDRFARASSARLIWAAPTSATFYCGQAQGWMPTSLPRSSRARRGSNAGASPATACAPCGMPLQYRGTPMTIEMDDQPPLRDRALMVLISNIQLYAGIVRPSPEARVDDGLLDVCIFKGTGFAYTARHFISIAAGRAAQNPQLLNLRGRHIRSQRQTAHCRACRRGTDRRHSDRRAGRAARAARHRAADHAGGAVYRLDFEREGRCVICVGCCY